MIYTVLALTILYVALWILFDLPKYWPEPVPSAICLSFGIFFLLFSHATYQAGARIRAARYQGISAIECGNCGAMMPNTCDGIAAHKCKGAKKC